MQLSINTGTIKIPINRNGEETGVLKFTPNDVAFANRYFKLLANFEGEQKRFKEKVKPIEKSNNTPELLSITLDLCNYIKEQIDFVFGANTSDMLFGDACTVDMFKQFFDGVTPLFMNARTGKIEKYTSENGSSVMDE